MGYLIIVGGHNIEKTSFGNLHFRAVEAKPCIRARPSFPLQQSGSDLDMYIGLVFVWSTKTA